MSRRQNPPRAAKNNAFVSTQSTSRNSTQSTSRNSNQSTSRNVHFEPDISDLVRNYKVDPSEEREPTEDEQSWSERPSINEPPEDNMTLIPNTRFGMINMIANIVFIMVEMNFEYYANAAVGLAFVVAQLVVNRMPQFANPTREMQIQFSMFVLLYFLLGAIWGYIPYYQCMTTTRQVTACVHRDLWRIILWPGALLTSLILQIPFDKLLIELRNFTNV